MPVFAYLEAVMCNRVLWQGVDEVRQELQDLVQFLKDPEKYAKLGAKVPHGVLLSGPPGTGTLSCF